MKEREYMAGIHESLIHRLQQEESHGHQKEYRTNQTIN
jgi:hypothetical protein